MAALRMRPAIIPTRILLMIIHLLLTIIAFVDRVLLSVFFLINILNIIGCYIIFIARKHVSMFTLYGTAFRLCILWTMGWVITNKFTLFSLTFETEGCLSKSNIY